MFSLESWSRGEQTVSNEFKKLLDDAHKIRFSLDQAKESQDFCLFNSQGWNRTPDLAKVLPMLFVPDGHVDQLDEDGSTRRNEICEQDENLNLYDVYMVLLIYTRTIGWK